MSTTVSLKEYFAAAGSQFTKADAELIGQQFETLAEQSPIDQRTIVDVARSLNSPLNRFFEWDDAVAGDRYRLGQAGEMMRSIKVRVIENDRPRAMPVYKFVQKSPETKPPLRGYNVLHEGAAFALKMGVQAFDDLIAWRVKYASYMGAWLEFASTFREVTNQISEFEDVGRPSGLDQEADEAVAALIAWRDRFGGVAPQLDGMAEQAGFLVEAIAAVEVAFVRPIVHSCLRCGVEFPSVGHGNRLCEKCSVAAGKRLDTGSAI